MLASSTTNELSPNKSHRKGLFFSGFGNREKDAVAYLSAGVPPERVLIIDTSSLIRARTAAPASSTSLEKDQSQRPCEWSSYAGLLVDIDDLFPRCTTEHLFAKSFAAHAAKAARSLVLHRPHTEIVAIPKAHSRQ